MAEKQQPDANPIEVFEEVEALASPLDRSRALERLGQSAASAVDADVGFVGLLTDEHLTLRYLHGATTRSLDGMEVERGHGLGGKVVAVRTPAKVDDYLSAPTITHEHDARVADEQLRAMLSVPLVLGEDFLGVVYVANRSGQRFTDVMIDRVVDCVAGAELATSLAMRSRELTDLAVARDRNRAAQELDEGVASLLGQIMDTARSIVADPQTSGGLVRQAEEIMSVSAKAQLALHTSVYADAAPAMTGVLSAREREVLVLAGDGLTNPQIAEQLHLARGTVKAYLESAYRKLDVHNRLEAVLAAKHLRII